MQDLSEKLQPLGTFLAFHYKSFRVFYKLSHSKRELGVNQKLTQINGGGEGVHPKLTDENDKAGVTKETSLIVSSSSHT